MPAPRRTVSESAALEVLEAVFRCDGQWLGPEYDRIFPPGWFRDEVPNTTAFDLLYLLMRQGDLGVTSFETGRRFFLTEKGRERLRAAGRDLMPSRT